MAIVQPTKRCRHHLTTRKGWNQLSSWALRRFKLATDGYVAPGTYRGERATYFIDPVVEGPHGVEFSEASIRYFLGRYNSLVVKFDRKQEGTSDKESEMGEIGSLAVREQFPMHQPDSSEGNVNPAWEVDGEFKAVWDGDELWLEEPLTHFCQRGKGTIFGRRTTSPPSPDRGVEDAMQFGRIEAAEGVVSSRLIRLVNNTKQAVRTCITPDPNPAEQAAKKKEVGVGLNVLGYGANAHSNRDVSYQHGAMGGVNNASLGAQHNALGPGEPYFGPLGGKGDGGVVWYTVDEFTPNDLESRRIQQAQLQGGHTPPAQAQAQAGHTPPAQEQPAAGGTAQAPTQSGHTPPAQAQAQSEEILACGFNLARLEVEHDYVVDQASRTFVRRRKSWFRLTQPDTFPWLVLVRIRHNARISPGWYNQMNRRKLTEKGVKDFVLRPKEDDVDQTVNQYIKNNMVL